MKHIPIVLWLLLPVLIAVLLLPPISYYVFRSEAEKQAQHRAEADLIALQKEIAALATETLPASDAASCIPASDTAAPASRKM